MTTPVPNSNITALILAGGRGTRMDGQDKGQIAIAGRPAIEHLLERIGYQCQHILISANRNLERYRSYGYRVVTDGIPGFAGPLAGIAAGLAMCDSDYLLILPVDAPLLSKHYLERMHKGITGSGKPACVAAFNGRMEPVFCLLNRSLATSLNGFLAAGGRAAHEWLSLIDAQVVDFSDCPEQFINLNRAEDCQALERHLDTGFNPD